MQIAVRRRDPRVRDKIHDLALRIFDRGRRRNAAGLADARIAVDVWRVWISDAVRLIVFHVALSWRPGHRLAVLKIGIVEDDSRVRGFPSVQQTLEIGRKPDAQVRIDAALTAAASQPAEARVLN